MSGGFGAYPEHNFRKVIPGDVETVRHSLCEVLEDFNYIVLSENPIQAKRSQQKNFLLSTMLDCDAKLTIALKSISPASTLATFDYAVPYLFTEGDMQALEREADAIIALATTTWDKSVCPSCDAENAGTTRFCRVCGTPIARNKLPAELEVMRLTASASSSFQEIIIGLVLIFLALLITVPMMFSDKPGMVNFAYGLLAVNGLIALFYLQLGIRRLHRAVKPQSAAQQEPQSSVPRLTPAQERPSLPAPPASITEGTTGLMNPPQRNPISIKQGKTTDSLE